MTIAEEKDRIRALARNLRRAAAEVPGAAEAIAAFAERLPDAAVTSFYMPMKEEVDPRPLADRLVARGTALALPYVAGGAMGFRAATELLVPGAFGTVEPAAGDEVVPDLLLVPVLAFTRAGGRLGYGQGYYDRWLAAHPGALAVGIAFAAQEFDALPLEPHDVPLDAILTEREAILIGHRAEPAT